MYSVKQFCDMIGVPTSTLRYYERIGLLSPQKNEKNNYREYTIQDAFRVNTFRSLRGMGFEAKEVLEMLRHQDASIFYDLMVERENKLIDEIFLMQEQLSAVQTYKRMLQLAQSEEQHMIGTRREMYFLKASHGMEFTESKYDQFSKWVQYVPVTRYAKYFEQEAFTSESLKEHMHYGISIECRYEYLLEPSAKENIKYLKGGECIYLHSNYFNYDSDFGKGQLEIQTLLDRYDYELDGPIYLEGTRVKGKDNTKGQFLSIPIRKAANVV